MLAAALLAVAPAPAWASGAQDGQVAVQQHPEEADGDEADNDGADDVEADEADVAAASDDGPGEAADGAIVADEAEAGAVQAAAQVEEGVAGSESPAEQEGDESQQAESDELVAASSSDGPQPATQAELDSATPSMADTGVVMYRLYNPYSGEHFYTSGEDERDSLSRIGWIYEGIGWVAPSEGDPVYRLYNPYSSDHHYTLAAEERDFLASIGWIYEGIGWFSGGAQALLRQFNPYETIGTHNYTCSQAENDYLASIGWNAEGVAWYALAETSAAFAQIVGDSYAGVLARVSTEDGEAHVASSYADGTYYLMLPSYADLSAVRVSGVFKGSEVPLMVASSASGEFNAIDAAGTLNVAALSSATADNGARLLWFKTPNTSIVQRLGVMVSASIDSLHVSSADASKGRAYVEASEDHSAKADVMVTMFDAAGAAVYDKDSSKDMSTIKGRGNSTWRNGEKKPYQISLGKKADLLGTGNKDNRQKKWVLLANANDPTLLHNTVAYDMALEMGLVGTECAPVDLYYDGQYRGNYLLCEKIQVKEGRVDIEDLEDAIEKANAGTDLESLPTARATNSYGQTYQYVAGVADPADITGGYLLEIDTAYYADEVCWFETSWGQIVVKSPEFCSQNAMKYISEYVEHAIRRLNSGRAYEGGSSDAGALFDIESLAKGYAISEYAKNIDMYCTSTYIYKDAGNGPLYSQPVWDFDGSMGTRHDLGNSMFMVYQGFALPAASRTVAAIPVVQERVRSIWADQLSPLIHNVLLSASERATGPKGRLHSLAYYRNQVSASQRMDEALFGLKAFGNEFKPYATYALNYDYLRNWLTWRAGWMDDNIWRLSGGQIRNAPYTYNGVDFGLVFDAGYYVKMNPDALASDTGDAAALEHFVNVGMSLGLVASRNFNAVVYRDRYEDLRNAYGDTLASYYWHYMDNGFWEGRAAA